MRSVQMHYNCWCHFIQVRFCLHVIEWINNRDIFQIKNAVNQALQHTRKKPLIEWLIRNRWWLHRQANLNLDSNHGLGISCTNDHMNDQLGERTNEGWVKIEWSLCRQQTTNMWTSVSLWYTPSWCQASDTFQTYRQPKPHGFPMTSMVSYM